MRPGWATDRPFAVQDGRAVFSGGSEVTINRFTPGEEPVFTFGSPRSIQLELPNPALRDTQWDYLLRTREVTENYCDYGFEWEICR